MTAGELKARLADVPDSAQVLEIARVVREPIPAHAEPVPAVSGQPVYVVTNGEGAPYIWPTARTPGEITLATLESGVTCFRSLGYFQGECRL